MLLSALLVARNERRNRKTLQINTLLWAWCQGQNFGFFGCRIIELFKLDETPQIMVAMPWHISSRSGFIPSSLQI